MMGKYKQFIIGFFATALAGGILIFLPVILATFVFHDGTFPLISIPVSLIGWVVACGYYIMLCVRFVKGNLRYITWGMITGVIFLVAIPTIMVMQYHLSGGYDPSIYTAITFASLVPLLGIFAVYASKK